MRFELVIKLLLASLNDSEKNCQGNKPENTIITYGVLDVWFSFATTPNMNVKIAIVISGFSKAHKMPRVVCLYFTLISRQLSIYNISLKCQMSFQ